MKKKNKKFILNRHKKFVLLKKNLNEFHVSDYWISTKYVFPSRQELTDLYWFIAQNIRL